MATVYETAIRIEAQLASNFISTTRTASTAIADLDKRTRALTSASTSAQSFVTLQREVTAATSAFDRAREAEAALRFEAFQTADGQQRLAKEINAAAKATRAAEKALNGKQAALKKVDTALRLAGVDTSRLADEQQRLQRELAQTALRAEGLARLQGAGKGIEAAAKKISSQVRSIAGDVARLAAAGTAGVVALGALIHRTIEAGDEIGDVSANLGLSTRALQELRFAAELGGSSAEDLDKAFAKFNETSGDALSGNAAATKSFQALGIPVKSLQGLNPEQRFNLVADALARIQDPAKRAAAAQNLFGRSSKTLVDLLGQGSVGINELRARSVGVLDERAVANAGEAKNALIRVRGAIGGVANILGAALLPVATRTFERLTTWITENQAQIREWATRAADWIEHRMIPALEKLGPRLLDLALKVGGLVERTAELVGGFGNLGGIIGALRLAPLALSVFQLTGNLVSGAVGLFQFARGLDLAAISSSVLNVALSPITLTVVAIGAAVAVTLAYLDELQEAAEELFDNRLSFAILQASGAIPSDIDFDDFQQQQKESRDREFGAKRRARIDAGRDDFLSRIQDNVGLGVDIDALANGAPPAAAPGSRLSAGDRVTVPPPGGSRTTSVNNQVSLVVQVPAGSPQDIPAKTKRAVEEALRQLNADQRRVAVQ